ncbi:MAG: alginate export family protein [Xanthomonadaceae bacterium]|nr:alginate export family protein [Xanthomonadaceae bacterium]
MKRTLIALAAALVAAPATADWTWDLRYRYEQVDDAALAERIDAQSVRLRLGWLWMPVERWSLYLEGEHSEVLADRLPADPPLTELNQRWLRWSGERVEATLGRQRLQFGNQRFVGNVGWRQAEQTFDALHLRGGMGVEWRYAYVDAVQRVNGQRRDHDSHLAAATWGRVQGYAFLFDDRTAPADSSMTVGLRWSGETGPLRWTIEGARQRDSGGQPVAYRADYFLVEPSVRFAGVRWAFGREYLGGDGVKGFATPFATLHAFNGWADRFLATPPDGLDDRYASATGTLARGTWTVVYHDYGAFGDEWNASYARPIGESARWLVKAADFSGGTLPSVRKLWLQLEWPAR